MAIFQRLAKCSEYEVCVFHGEDFPGTKVVNAASIDGVPHKMMWTVRGLSNLLRLPQWPLCPGLIPNLWRFRPDVILAEGNSNLLNNIQLFIYARLTRTPVVFWTLGALRDKQVTRPSQRLFRALTRWMESQSTALLGYSSVALDYFSDQGYPTEKQFRAVNVVDTERVAQRIEDARGDVASIRSRLNLDGKKVVLFVGAVIAAKRLEDLVDAFQIVTESVPDARLVLVGDGPYADRIRQHIAQSAAADRIIMTGKVVQGVSAYFLLGDVLVLPHLGGLAISEAMVHGLPIVATRADGCEVDLIEEGQNGYRLPVGRPDLIADKIVMLLTNDELRLNMQRHALSIIANKHNVHTYLRGIRSAIDYAASGTA